MLGLGNNLSPSLKIWTITWLATFLMNLVRPSGTVLEFSLARFRDTAVYANNSVIDINLIGEGYPGLIQTNGGALECHTDDTTCCRGIDNPDGPGRGEWYYPDGTVVPPPPQPGSNETAHLFYRTRDHMVIRLNRVDRDLTAVSLHGLYRCEIPSAEEDSITRYTNLYDEGGRCSDLKQIDNGIIDYTPPHGLSSTLNAGQRYIGTVATYICLPGYQLMGESLLRVCILNESLPDWNGTEPACVVDGQFSLDQQCYEERENIFLQCSVNASGSVLKWNGYGFNCPSSSSADNNTISLEVLCFPEQTGVCGPYYGNLTCPNQNSTEVISWLTFMANYSMNKQSFECLYKPGNIDKSYPIRVGVIPGPPTLALPLTSVAFITRENAHQYFWSPPEEPVIGGIRGYNLSSLGDCGNCTTGMVDSDTLSAVCSGWMAQGQICTLKVKTVSADCGFVSIALNISVSLYGVAPADIEETLLCSISADTPSVYVKWKYTPPVLENTTTPEVQGFVVFISDVFNNSYESAPLGPEARSYDGFNSTLLEEANLTGDLRSIRVTVMTETGNFSSISNFSVESTMTDPNPTLNQSQCIEVSVNSNCNESAESFQAQLQYTEGLCVSEVVFTPTQSTSSYPLSKDYKTCVPFNHTGTICYSALVYRDGVLVGRTERQQLILLPCNTSSLNFDGAIINMGEVMPGEEVAHNTKLELQCDTGYSLTSGSESLIFRCVNGTIQPRTDGTPCTRPPGNGEIVAAVVISIMLVILIVTVIVIVTVIIVKWNTIKEWLRKKGCCTENREQQPVELKPGGSTGIKTQNDPDLEAKQGMQVASTDDNPSQ